MSSFESAADSREAPRFIAADARDDAFVANDLFKASRAAHEGEGHCAGATDEASAEWRALEELSASAYREGEAAGRALAAQELGGVAELLAVAAETFDEQRRTYLHAQRRAMAELAIAIAGQVIGSEIEAQPDLLVGRIDRALAMLPDDEPLLVQMNPSQYAALVEHASPAFSSMSASRTFRIEASADLAAGDIRVRSGASSVDARIETALGRVRHELAGLEQLEGSDVGSTE